MNIKYFCNYFRKKGLKSKIIEKIKKYEGIKHGLKPFLGRCKI